MQQHNSKLPTDLRADAATAFTALNVFCDILIAYDASHNRGKPS